MSDENTASGKFSCEQCNRAYTWKPELAGKRVKCKCGNVMTVPQQVAAPEEAEEDLYAFADEDLKAHQRPTPAVIPPTPQPQPIRAPTIASSGMPLAYQRGPTSREIAHENALLDTNRDIYIPVGLLISGFLLHVGYYAISYKLGPVGIAGASLALGVLGVIEATVLVGFALMVAGPLGVSFGTLGTAALKLAAIAVFIDGTTTWVDALIARSAGGIGGGFMGFGVIGFPVALGLYWGLLIWLFNMDPGDSWTVVIILSIFYRVLKTVLFFLLLGGMMSLVGVASIGNAIAVPSSSSSAALESSDPLADTVSQLKASNALLDARKYIAAGQQIILGKYVEGWHAHGCQNVWFEMNRKNKDQPTADRLIIELPQAKAERSACYKLIKQYYDEAKITFDEADLQDEGKRYADVEIQ